MREILTEYQSLVHQECYLISKEVRSCATFTIREFEGFDDINEVLFTLEQDVLSYGLKFVSFVRDEVYSKYYDCWIYSYNHQYWILNYLNNLNKSENKTILAEWLTGKLLGYSDSSIEDYLSKILFQKV